MLDTSFIFCITLVLPLPSANISFIIAEITFSDYIKTYADENNFEWIPGESNRMQIVWGRNSTWKCVCVCGIRRSTHTHTHTKPNELWILVFSLFIYCQCISNIFPLYKLSMLCEWYISRISPAFLVSFIRILSHMCNVSFSTSIEGYFLSQTYRRIPSFSKADIRTFFTSIYLSWIFGFVLCKRTKK